MGSSLYDFSQFGANPPKKIRGDSTSKLPDYYNFSEFNPTEDDIDPNPKPANIGFWDVLNGISKTVSLLPLMVGSEEEINKSSLSDDDKRRLRNLKTSFKNRQGFLDALMNAGGDINKIATTEAGATKLFGDIGTAVSTSLHELNPEGTVLGAVGGVAKAGMGLPAGLLNMAGTPIAAFTGIDNATGDILNEEDRARAIKGTVGLVAQMYIAGGVGKLSRKIAPLAQDVATVPGLVGSAVGNVVDDALIAEVRRLAQTSYKKGIARNIADGIAKGTISGSAYGLIEGANEDDQINSVINNGIIFGTIFSVLDVSGTRKQIHNERLLGETATKIAAWRKLNFDRRDSLLDIINKAELIKNADDFIDANFLAHMNDPNKDGITIFEDISPDGGAKLDNQYLQDYSNNAHVNYRLFKRIDGHKQSVAVYPEHLIEGTGLSWGGIFQDTGFFPNELVVYNGKVRKVVTSALDRDTGQHTNLLLQDNIAVTEVKSYEVRRPTQEEIVQSKVTLTRLVDDADKRILNEPRENGYVGANVEEINKGYFYHGGSAQYGVEDLDPGVQDLNNLVGPAYYTTRGAEVTLGYASGRGGNTDRTIYKMRMNLKKVWDAELPLPDEVHDAWVAHLEEWEPTSRHSSGSKAQNLIDMVKRDRVAYKNDPDLGGMNGMALYQFMRDIGNDLSQVDHYEFMHDWNKRLRFLGYDAITHIGGLRAGRGKYDNHQVVVLIDPKNKYNLPVDKIGGGDVADFEMKREYNAVETKVTPTETKTYSIGEKESDGMFKELGEAIYSDMYANFSKLAPWVEGLNPDGSAKLDEGTFGFIARDIMKRRGYVIDPATHKSVLTRLAKEVTDRLNREALDANDLAVINHLKSKYADKLDVGSFEDYVKYQALTNDFDIISADGQFYLNERESGKFLGKANTMGEIVEFINTTRQKNPLTKDPLSDLPPGSIDVPPGDSGPKPEEPIFKTPTRLEQIFAQINRVAKYHTNYIKLFESIDISSKGYTKFLTEVGMPLQGARQKENAYRQPWLGKLQKLYNTHKKITQDRWMIISGYLEAASPNDVISQTLGKSLDHNEIAAAQEFVKRGINEKNVIEFLRKSAKMTDLTQVQLLKEKLGLDSLDGDVGIGLFRGLQKLGVNPNTLVSVTRLIRSYGGDLNNNANWTLSKQDWAAKYKMTPQEQVAARQIEEMFVNVAAELGIPTHEVVSNMISYANMYSDGNMKIALGDIGDAGFLSDLLWRTGEFKNQSMHPIVQLQKFINGGFNAKYFQPELKTAKQNYTKYRQELIKRKENALADNAKDYWKRYIADIRGWPDKYDITINDAINKMGDAFGQDWDANFKKDIVNAITKTLELGIQGGRLKAGILDFYTGFSLYSAHFGYKETGEMLIKGMKEWKNEDYIKAGIVPGLDIETAADPAGNQAGQITGMAGQALDKVMAVGLRLSGQKDIYNIFQQGAYVMGQKRASEALTRYTEHKDLARLEKEVRLSSYGTPVANKFLELATKGPHEQAIKLIASHTPRLVVPTYGNANNPYGWKNSFMRLSGQFGTYSSFARYTMQDLSARGSLPDRFARLSRFAASQAFLVYLSAELGLNLSSWYFHKAVVPNPGPAFQTGYNALQAVGGNSYQQSQAREELLRTLAESPIYFPFGLLYRDIVEANKAYDLGKVDSPLNIRSFGIQLSKKDRDWDEVLGEDALGFLPDNWFNDY